MSKIAPEYIFRNVEYERCPINIPTIEREVHYTVASLDGHKYFFKTWGGKALPKGVIECVDHSKLIHPYIIRLLDYDIRPTSITMKFEYLECKTLQKIDSISMDDFDIIMNQLTMAIDYLKSVGVIDYIPEKREDITYYSESGVTIDPDHPHCKWDFGMGNILWDNIKKQIKLIDFERHDKRWPDVFRDTEELIRRKVKGYADEYTDD